MRRLVVLRLTILLAFFALINQLWVLQFEQGEQLTQNARVNTFRNVYERPLRGEIYAKDGQTLLAESLPSYTIAILKSQLPKQEAEKQAIFAWLDDLLQLQSTLTVTPTEQLTYEPRLQQDIEQITGPFETPPPSLTESFAITVPLSRSGDAFQLSREYTGTLKFRSPIEDTIQQAGLPAYETVPLTTTQNLTITRIIEENKSISPGLPGVQVEPNYQRFYPLSAEVQSLSHLLGYVGSVDKCDIIRNNPYAYWPTYLLDEIKRAPDQVRQTCFFVKTDERDELAELTAAAKQRSELDYLLTDRIGREGLERSYEHVLRGQMGEKEVEVDVKERLVAEPQVKRPTEMGNNLVLTIDYDLQKKTEDILRKWINESERRRQTAGAPARPGQADKRQYFPIEAGVAIALDAQTGRVLSMVSWPSYDNNIFNRRIKPEEAEAIFNPGYPKQAPAINQATQGLFPPGSTWKQISAAAALTYGSIVPDSMIRDPGHIDVKNDYFESDPKYDLRFPNSIRRDNGWLSVRQALQVSSNVFFQSVIGGTKSVRNLADGEKIEGLGKDANKLLADMARGFGFGSKTGIPLPGEALGRIPSAEWKAQQPGEYGRLPWSIGDTYNTAIGQGNLVVTPLQLAVASAAVANGGTLYQPQLVEKIVDADGQLVEEVAPVVKGTLPVSPEHLQVIREGMRQSITAPGTLDACARSDVSGLEIAGKTGTAEYFEQIDPTKQDYSEANFRKRSHAWFVGFAPYDNPEIEVLVLVEGAGDMSDGSATIAVPAVTEIMQAYYNVTPPLDPATPIPPYNLPCH